MKALAYDIEQYAIDSFEYFAIEYVIAGVVLGTIAVSILPLL